MQHPVTNRPPSPNSRFTSARSTRSSLRTWQIVAQRAQSARVAAESRVPDWVVAANRRAPVRQKVVLGGQKDLLAGRARAVWWRTTAEVDPKQTPDPHQTDAPQKTGDSSAPVLSQISQFLHSRNQALDARSRQPLQSARTLSAGPSGAYCLRKVTVIRTISVKAVPWRWRPCLSWQSRRRSLGGGRRKPVETIFCPFRTGAALPAVAPSCAEVDLPPAP